MKEVLPVNRFRRWSADSLVLELRDHVRAAAGDADHGNPSRVSFASRAGPIVDTLAREAFRPEHEKTRGRGAGRQWPRLHRL